MQEKDYIVDYKTITKSKTSTTISKLVKGKKYYVKVRAYKIDSAGIKVYGKHSKVTKVTIKNKKQKLINTI